MTNAVKSKPKVYQATFDSTELNGSYQSQPSAEISLTTRVNTRKFYRTVFESITGLKISLIAYLFNDKNLTNASNSL